MMHQSTCRSCGRPIRWAKTPGGKAMPLDLEPHPQGNVTLGEDGMAQVLGDMLTRAAAANAGVRLYRSHFATCLHAAAHRRD